MTSANTQISTIELWHRRARPAPTAVNHDVQLGCHLEEIVEMLDTLSFVSGYSTTLGKHSDVRNKLDQLARALKSGDVECVIVDRKEYLDALADQVVTTIGAGHCANMKMGEALERVNTSNWSKFDDNGQPIFNASGKIAKGPNYKPVDLTGLY